MNPLPSPPIHLGLRANLRQFSLLVLVNAFVGSMVGLERTVVPLLAEGEFGLVARTVLLSFLLSFGLVKALANLFAGHLSDRWGRKPVLLAGWLFGLPVPLLIIFAPNWEWVVFANVLLGVNQGLCWSTTVVMKIDLVGPRQRGLAMGLNEFSGYLAVSLAAFGTGYLAAIYGLRPAPFYPGLILALLGLSCSALLVRETRGYARREAQVGFPAAERLSFSQVFRRTTYQDHTLFSACQCGLVNNLNDGLAWGLLPVFLAGRGLPLAQVGLIAALYPGVWGLGQLFTGALSDRWGRKWMIAAGMWVQAAGLGLFVIDWGFGGWVAGAVLMGLGTALVYPTLLAAVADVAPPQWRASAVGVYRLWRDSGYAFGALLAGLVADAFGVPAAIAATGGLTLLSGLLVAGAMRETASRSPAFIPVPELVSKSV
ncbi:MAG: MFS transporter [Candidatus Latescibacteria bacterium]|nr:MFS transporter [Candidatus Latescibacterota bacterium]